MRFSPELLAEIEERTPLSELAGETVKLKRVGGGFAGLCPFHPERTPSFTVNDVRRTFKCFGCGESGDVFAFVMKTRSVTFPEAVEALAERCGVPVPGATRREARPAARVVDHDEFRRRAEERERAEARRRTNRVLTAREIWGECVAVEGTLAEQYLLRRGIPVPTDGWPEVLAFHRGMEWELGAAFDGPQKIHSGPFFPCLVARVQDARGETTAIWRVFLNCISGDKAPVKPCKLGLGPAKGGAVRIGGSGRAIGVAEGIESALAAWTIEHYRFPVWAALSTSGLMGLDIPAGVERVLIFPDGDAPGQAAASHLQDRCNATGVACTMVQAPRNADFADVLVATTRRGII